MANVLRNFVYWWVGMHRLDAQWASWTPVTAWRRKELLRLLRLEMGVLHEDPLQTQELTGQYHKSPDIHFALMSWSHWCCHVVWLIHPPPQTSPKLHPTNTHTLQSPLTARTFHTSVVQIQQHALPNHQNWGRLPFPNLQCFPIARVLPILKQLISSSASRSIVLAFGRPTSLLTRILHEHTIARKWWQDIRCGSEKDTAEYFYIHSNTSLTNGHSSELCIERLCMLLSPPALEDASLFSLLPPLQYLGPKHSTFSWTPLDARNGHWDDAGISRRTLPASPPKAGRDLPGVLSTMVRMAISYAMAAAGSWCCHHPSWPKFVSLHAVLISWRLRK